MNAVENRINIDLVHERVDEEEDFFVSTGRGSTRGNSPGDRDARANERHYDT